MHDKMLAVVQRLVKPHGLRTARVHRIGMLLRGDGMPAPKAPITHHAPDLTVYDDAGWVIATVTIGPRAGHYLISLPTVDVGCQTVNADQPHAVVDMICAARGAAA
ncbi:hypothetical protein [Planomonospora sp. ID82291]|uniref:hypothetical protein n=1 Tax=Planomonospora sp. ID82291 TaxID=2738136 RepID=UPI0018C36D47|nr:hypothetical protein [Planomonospora sp. ID82291]MBG0818609.1 hypothetical protein [Planomonospora sp. ID82291]